MVSISLLIVIVIKVVSLRFAIEVMAVLLLEAIIDQFLELLGSGVITKCLAF